MALKILSDLSLEGNQIKSVADPTHTEDGVPKGWADGAYILVLQEDEGIDIIDQGGGVKRLKVRVGKAFEFDDTGGIRPVPGDPGLDLDEEGKLKTIVAPGMEIEADSRGVRPAVGAGMEYKDSALGIKEKGVVTAMLDDDSVDEDKLAFVLAVPLKVDNGNLIVDLGPGLGVDDDKLRIPVDGIVAAMIKDGEVTVGKLAFAIDEEVYVDDDTLKLRIDEGLEVDAVSKGVRPKLHGTLYINGSGEVEVRLAADSGLVAHSSGLHIGTGDGVQVSGGTISALISDGLEFDNGAIKAKLSADFIMTGGAIDLDKKRVFGEQGPSYKTIHTIIGDGTQDVWNFDHTDPEYMGKPPSLPLMMQMFLVQSGGNDFLPVGLEDITIIQRTGMDGWPYVIMNFNTPPSNGVEYRVLIIG